MGYMSNLYSEIEHYLAGEIYNWEELPREEQDRLLTKEVQHFTDMRSLEAEYRCEDEM